MTGRQVFDILDPATEAALRASIERHGVLVPVAIDQNGEIIDGHHRARIARELDVSFDVRRHKIRDEDHARELAITLNADRRQLTLEQRRAVVADLRASGHSTRAIAGAVGVTHPTVLNDLSGGKSLPPEEIIGRDGKTYPAHRIALDAEQKNPVLYTSESDDWWTPTDVLDRVVATLGAIDLDPCSNLGSPNVPAARHLTVEDDGLTHGWVGRIFMNPPYGDVLATWVTKLVSEYQQGNIEQAIALVPGRIDTKWCAELDPYLRCHIRGRLKFSGQSNSAPFPSMAVYLGSDERKFIDAFSPIGTVFGRVE